LINTDTHGLQANRVLRPCRAMDGLTGFPEAINAIFPKTEVQLCVIHQIRNSLKYVASKNQKEFMADLKPVYKAETAEAAEVALDFLEEKWGAKYPIVIKSWRKKWPNLSTCFKYPNDIRRVIYTTNAPSHRCRQRLPGNDRSCPPPVPKTDQNQGRVSKRKQPAETALHGHPERVKKLDHATAKLEFDTVATLDLF